MIVTNGSPKGKALITGGSGFIASHIVDTILEHGFEAVVTTRSEEKGRTIIESIEARWRKNISYAVVEDITADGAFDKVLQSAPFEYVVHTASPYHFNLQDPVKDFLDPAIKGTTGLLKSIKAHAPTVRRVVITSSSAAIINPKKHPPVYDESYWAPWTWEEAAAGKFTYEASKVFSERAAWAFVCDEQPNFDLATINNTYTFGPVQRRLPNLEAMNTSNHRIRDMMAGAMREKLNPTFPVFTFVDVRDVALAHLRAMTIPEAGGHRFYIVGGHFSNKQIADAIRDGVPLLRNRLPDEEKTVDDIPDDVYQFDNGKSRKILRLEYTPLDKSVKDTVGSILELFPSI